MKKIIWIIVILLIVFGCYWFFFVVNNPSGRNGGEGQLKSLFPYGVQDFGTNENKTSQNNPNNAHTENNTTQEIPYDPLIQISKRAIVGMTIASRAQQDSYFLSGASSTTESAQYQSTIFSKTKLPVVRFAEHGTGYIYDVDARAQNETKQTGTTILRAYEAYFGDAGNSVIFRYVKGDNLTIETFLGKIIPPEDAESGQFASVKGDFLPEGILNVNVSPDGKFFDYVLPTDSGVSGVSKKMDGSGEQQLFSNDFSEWLFDLKQGVLSATTKASSGIPGYSYIVSNTGIFKKVLGDIDGLTTNISPDSRQLLYNSADGNSIVTYIRQANGNSNKLDISTLAEKCIWSKKSISLYCAVPNSIPGGSYPDDWYQGLAHFQDGIWKVDSVTGKSIKINDLAGKNIDAVSLMLDQNENYLFFKNNNDGTPWSLDLNAVPIKGR